MTPSTRPLSPPAPARRNRRGDLLYVLAVAAAYLAAMALAIHLRGLAVDRMMTIAEQAFGGHLEPETIVCWLAEIVLQRLPLSLTRERDEYGIPMLKDKS